ncbi:helix-turn-helix domain-containing protein [Epibacterium ulvae]|uniref:GlxA family transcriptional regulator n=1 Tax=Epibacterium ulvae TaxID=1156985 RepID=UPI001BFC623C|nr:helix-turn-helix domain-containing protein [Epibacterium ulvae]MBT8154821.1 helix-turn-helix domain-containing protein [Epibacterium ulvae]
MEAKRKATMMLAIDAATWVLASAGLLDGHKATLHWQELDTFAEVEVTTARFFRSGRFMICGGASTALDMILSLIQGHFGAAAAFDASTMFIYDPERQSEIGRGAVRLREQGSAKLLAALDVMAEDIEQPLTTFELAARSSLSERSLNGLFQAELGLTPGKYCHLFRLKRARTLAEDTQLSQEQIALRCGFSSGVSLSRSFRAEFGVSIRETRGK